MYHVTVTLDGEPLRRTFVSHHPDFTDPTVVITDGDGIAEFPNLAANSRNDLIVHAQNVAVRMLDGGTTSSVEKSLRFRNKKHGSRLNISEKDDLFPYFQIMDRCYDVYATVFGPIAPFSRPSRREFPFGDANKPAHELKRNPSVDCRYPETVGPGKLPWVQPQSVMGARPLMHIKGPNVDRRLFGTAKRPAITVPHEYAHALHFALLSTVKRWLLAAKYGVWIVKELATGNSGTHRTELKTAPLIAYVESFGIFSQRFYLFATQVRPDLLGASLHKAFVADELSGSPALAQLMPSYVKVGTRRSDGSITPHLKGNSTEGAVYGSLFLDLASRTSLATAVNLYLRCGEFDIAGYFDYAGKQRKGAYRDDIRAVVATWKI